MAVAREARGQGIGARLLELADAELPPAAGRIVLAAQLAAVRSTTCRLCAPRAGLAWTPGSSACGWRRPVPEIRIDPLSGPARDHRGRALRPSSACSRRPPSPPFDPERDRFLEGHEDRAPPELDALRPGGSAPDTPGWQVRVVPNLYPALEAEAAAPPREARTDLSSAQRLRAAATR